MAFQDAYTTVKDMLDRHLHSLLKQRWKFDPSLYISYSNEKISLANPEMLDAISSLSLERGKEFPFFFLEKSGKIEITDIGREGTEQKASISLSDAEIAASKYERGLNLGFGHTHTSGFPKPSILDMTAIFTNTIGGLHTQDQPLLNGYQGSQYSIIMSPRKKIVGAFDIILEKIGDGKIPVVNYHPILNI